MEQFKCNFQGNNIVKDYLQNICHTRILLKMQ